MESCWCTAASCHQGEHSIGLECTDGRFSRDACCSPAQPQPPGHEDPAARLEPKWLRTRSLSCLFFGNGEVMQVRLAHATIARGVK